MLMHCLSLLERHGVFAAGQEIAIFYKPQKVSSLIRIKSADCSVFIPLKNPDAYVDILEMEFDDIDNIGKETVEEILEKGFTVFTPKHAALIVDFFEKYEAYPLVTHCQAGLSRSPAVAVAFSYYKRDVAGYTSLKVEYAAANILVLNELKAEIDRRAVSAGLDPFKTALSQTWTLDSA